MNKLKIKSRKTIIERLNIEFKDVKGLVADVSIKQQTNTPDGLITTVESCSLSFDGDRVYYIPPHVIEEFVIDTSDYFLVEKFYMDHVSKEIKEYSIDELKEIDLSNLYVIKNKNLFNVKTKQNVGKWFFLEYDNTASNYEKLWKFIESKGFKTKPLTYKHTDFSSVKTQCIVSVDGFEDCVTLIEGYPTFVSKDASEKLINMWLESK